MLRTTARELKRRFANSKQAPEMEVEITFRHILVNLKNLQLISGAPGVVQDDCTSAAIPTTRKLAYASQCRSPTSHLKRALQIGCTGQGLQKIQHVKGAKNNIQ